jgi:hypothetical protein
MTAATTRILGPECTFPMLNKCEAKFSTFDLRSGVVARCLACISAFSFHSLQWVVGSQGHSLWPIAFLSYQIT